MCLLSQSATKKDNRMIVAPSPSGKARVCKTLTTSSNLVGASNYAGVAKWQTHRT